ncbi:glycosyltransferase [Photobacterium carnosum]|uniref:glycosyltransferase n=1 Tax=Photobacterium carnosum TaxID=2023717 RepID=UPI001E33D93A|nr:glycosyltransferase [Photobacterium carnosum]MCD9526025.1 glycosyltransferase [Photobacterium carnosum]
MKFVFVTCRLVMGGNEILIKKMSEWLLENGHDVDIITAQGGYLEDKMPVKAGVHVLGSFNFGSACVPLYPYNKKIKKIFKNADVLMGFSSGGHYFTYSLYKRYKCKGKLISGVFHPNTGVGEMKYFNSIFENSIFHGNRIYMNQAIIDDHSSQGLNTDDVKCWSLPVIGELKTSDLNEKFNSIKLLSIGRLTKFKTYNLYMIPIIRNLIDMGFNVEWHIIGDDEENTREPVKDLMFNEIEKLGLEENIKILGVVEYDQLSKYLSTSKIFIGMGTSAIEACSNGIPTICAIVDDEKGLSYGYLWDQPHGCVGEKLVGKNPTNNVANMISNILEMPIDEYKKLVDLSYNCAEQYMIEGQMNEFMNLVKDAKYGFVKKAPGRYNHIYNQIMKKLK